MAVTANFKAMFTRHAIESPNWRLAFTAEQTKLKRITSAQFIVPYLCLFAATSAIYLNFSSNSHKKSVVAVEAISLFFRFGYQYCITKPTKTDWKYRAKSSFGEGLSMAASFLSSVVAVTYFSKGKSSLTADYFLNAMILKIALGSRYYYESFLSLGSPSGLDSRQLLRWGKSKPEDIKTSTELRFCGCCCPGSGLTPLNPQGAVDLSTVFMAAGERPASDFRPVSGVVRLTLAPALAADMA